MNIRRAVAALLLTFLALTSWTPTMCAQCQGLTGHPGQDASFNRWSAKQEMPQTATTGEDCQHMAGPSGSAAYRVSAGACRDNPCRQSLNPASEPNRPGSAQFSGGDRFAVAGEIFGDEFYFSKDAFGSAEQRSRSKPSRDPSLLISLKI